MTKPNLTLVNPTPTEAAIIQQCLNPTMSQIIHAKFQDAMTPGLAVPFDPDEAEYAGAFVERALSKADVLASSIDLVGDLHE